MTRHRIGRLAPLAAVAALALPSFAAAEAIDPAQLYQQTIRGVCLIIVDDGSGSGWLIDRERRLIVTNHHVAGTSSEIRVYFPRFENGELVTNRSAYTDKRGLSAKRLLTDPKTDLAILQLESLPPDAVPLPLAEKSPGPAERIHAIGNPGASGALWNYHTGTVRQIYRKQIRDEKMNFDAFVVESTLAGNPGDSGGPVLNDQAQVVAVTSHASRGNLISDSIDVREVKAVLANALAGKRGVRGRDEAAAAPRGKRDDDSPARPGKSGGSAADLLKQGDKLKDQKKYDEALQKYAEAIQADSDFILAYTQRAWVFNELGKYAEAERECKRAETRDIEPGTPAIYRERGYSRFRLKKYDDALTDLNKAIKLEPTSASTYGYRADVLIAMKEEDSDPPANALTKALADCDRYIEMMPESAPGYNRRGRVNMLLKKYDEAMRDFTKAIDKNDSFALAYANRGYAQFLRVKGSQSQPDLEKALKDLNKAIRMDGNVAVFFEYRAQVNDALGNSEDAAADKKKARKLKGA